MKHYHQMSLSELLSVRQILSAQYDLCLMYYLASTCNFYMYQANHYNLRRDKIDSILHEAYNIHVDNLAVSHDLLSQFSCN